MSDTRVDPLRSVLAELAPQGRSALLPALQAAQRHHGWIDQDIAKKVSVALGVPLADVFGVLDFYAMLYREPVGRTVLRVCSAPVCAIAGADAVAESLCRHLKIAPGEITSDGEFTIEYAPCLGLCDRAPAVLAGEAVVAPADPVRPASISAPSKQSAASFVGGDVRLLTTNCGEGRTTSLSEYRERGGYAGLKKALTMTPESVLAEVKSAGLVGRGGAAFPPESNGKAPLMRWAKPST